MQRVFLFWMFWGLMGPVQHDLRRACAQEAGQKSSSTVTLQASSVTLQSSELTESSGVAQIDELLWTHNDSGDRPRLFAFGQDGSLRAEFDISGAQALDWEDICAFTRNGQNYLAVGDVGDNNSARPSVNIYVIEIPKSISRSNAASRSEATTSEAVNRLSVLTTYEVTYPTGPVNCEALAYDPLQQAFVLASKELTQCRLFRVPAKVLSGTQQLQAEPVGAIRLPLVTGGDISPDGKQLVLTTYGPGCLLQRSASGAGERDAPAVWQTDGDEAALIFELPSRRQGESICFSADGQRLWLTSEHLPTPLINIAIPQSHP